VITGCAVTSFIPKLLYNDVYRLEEIPVANGLQSRFFPKTFKLPRPVFPEGSEDEIVAVRDYTGPWYIVYKGFRAGVYTTWANGAHSSVTRATENKHEKVIDAHYEDACNMLMDSFKNNQVCNIPYIITS
jgi:hypothetical protein